PAGLHEIEDSFELVLDQAPRWPLVSEVARDVDDRTSGRREGRVGGMHRAVERAVDAEGGACARTRKASQCHVETRSPHRLGGRCAPAGRSVGGEGQRGVGREREHERARGGREPGASGYRNVPAGGDLAAPPPAGVTFSANVSTADAVTSRAAWRRILWGAVAT